MSRTETVLQDIKRKIAAMKRRQDALLRDNEMLKERLSATKEQLGLSHKQVEDVERELKSMRMAQTIGGEAEETRETKLKINEMVKEIDRCIAMLNK